MQFYAYIPREDGSVPVGTEKQYLFELKTIAGAIRRCTRVMGGTFVLLSYRNFYDNKTFSFLHGRGLTRAQWEKTGEAWQK